MKLRMNCDQAFPRLHELERDELGDHTAEAVGEHARSCDVCRAELAEIRRADSVLDVLRSDELLEDAHDLQLPVMRSRIMAEVRADKARQREAASVASPLSGWAAAAAAVVVAVGLSSYTVPGAGSGGGATAISEPPGLTSARLEPADLVTTVSADGVVELSWQGDEPTYRVLKSRRPGDFDHAEETIVCGKKWTDRDSSPGLVYYTVLPAADNCRT